MIYHCYDIYGIKWGKNMNSTLSTHISEEEILDRIVNNKLYLLGQVSVTQDEIDDLYQYTKNLALNTSLYLKEFSSDLKLSLALVQIAIYEYQEGNYWDRFCDRLDIQNFSPVNKTFLGKIFLNTIEEYKLFELDDEYSSGKRNQYVENIKAHAFITNNYMKDYFEFLNDYYENNLFRDLSGNIEENLQDLSDYIKTIRNSDKDTLDDEYRSTKKSYKLLKSSRAVIAQCAGDILYQLFYPSLMMIHQNVSDYIIPKNTEDRFVKGFIDWIDERKNENKEERKNPNGRKPPSKKPYITMSSGKIGDFTFQLVIPKRTYRPSECDGNVNVEIIIDEFSRNKSLNVYTHLGSYISDEYRLKIDNPIAKIEIYINDEHFVIDNRNYILFDSDCNNINKLCKDKDNFLFTPKEVSVRFSDENCLKDSYHYDDYNYYQFFVKEDTICYVNNSPLSIIGEYTEEPIFEDLYYGVIRDKDNNRIIAGRIHPSISFTLNNNELQGTVISINGNKIHLISSDIQIFEYPNDDNKKIISIDVNKLIKLIDNEYIITLDIPGKNNKVIAKYLILQNFYYRFDKSRYVDEKFARLKVKVNSLDARCECKNVKLVYYNNVAQNLYYDVDLYSGIRKIDFKITFNNNDYFAEIPIKMVLHGNSIENMKYGKENNVWYNNISNILYVKLPGAKRVGAYYAKEMDEVIWGKEIGNELFQINIIPLLNMVRANTKDKYQYISIRYEDNQLRWMSLFTILRQIIINPYFKLEYYQNVIGISVDNIIGKENAKVYFDIKDSETGEIIVNNRELLEGINQLPEMQREKYYTIIPYMVEVDEFGFQGKSSSLPVRSKQGFISYQNTKLIEKKSIESLIKNNNLKNITIIIDKITCCKKDIEINRLVKYTIDHLEKNKDILSGRLNEVHYIQKFNDPNSLTRYNNIHLGNIRMYDYKINQDNIEFKMDSYSKKDDSWEQIYYYSKKQILIQADNDILYRLKYNEAIMLDEDTLYKAKLKGR